MLGAMDWASPPLCTLPIKQMTPNLLCMLCRAALLRILEAMDMAVPPPATEEEAAAAASAATQAQVMDCGEADRPLRLAFRSLLAYLTVRPGNGSAVSKRCRREYVHSC